MPENNWSSHLRILGFIKRQLLHAHLDIIQIFALSENLNKGIIWVLNGKNYTLATWL